MAIQQLEDLGKLRIKLISLDGCQRLWQDTSLRGQAIGTKEVGSSRQFESSLFLGKEEHDCNMTRTPDVSRTELYQLMQDHDWREDMLLNVSLEVKNTRSPYGSNPNMEKL